MLRLRALRDSERLLALVRSVGVAILARVLSISLSLIAVPITLRYLGTAQYGQLTTITSIVGLLAFADLGLGNGLLNLISERNSRSDQAGVRRAIAAGVIATSMAAVAVLLLLLLIWPWINWSSVLGFGTSGNSTAISISVLALISVFAINLPVSTYQKIQYGLQRGQQVGLSQIISSLLAIAFVLLVVHFDLGIIGFAACFMLAPLLSDALLAARFFAKNAILRPGAVDWDRDEFKRLLKLGALFLTLQVGVSLCYASDNLIISHFLGAESVAKYVIHQKLFIPLTLVAGLVLPSLWPAFADAVARKDYQWIRRSLCVSAGAAFMWALACGAAICIAAGWLMAHWLKGVIGVDAFLCYALVLWATVDLVGRTIAMFLNGAGILRQQLWIVAIFVPLCVVMKCVLVQVMGVSGIAVGTALAWLVVHVPAYSILLRRWFRLNRIQVNG